jgi:peptidoglycan/LPS O-acetylase OafA/YrhL
MSVIKDKNDQFAALTSLRFLAALLVFVYHFQPRSGVLPVVIGQGHVGVGLFFVLSGFLITLRYFPDQARGEFRVGEYFLRRAARILPLYYTVFILSQYLAYGGLSFAERLPEWTLTQALFGESLHLFVIPTSWSLTVEECFYAVAPLVFLAIAAAQRRAPRRPMLAAAAVLLGLTVLLFAAGATIWTILDGRGPGFLRDPEKVALHTLFGRFWDFAVGAFAALLFASPSSERWRRILGRPIPALLATCGAVALIVTAQWGMYEAGGLDGPRWAWAWSWDLLLPVAAASLVVSLTSSGNPLARLLSLSPFVYLGKVSYALYLVQLTPIGKGLFYRVLPRTDDVALVALYAGITAVSAILYELVEEPARRLILRTGGLARGSPGRTAPALVRLGAAAALALSLASQSATWAVASVSGSLGPVTLAEVRAAGTRARDLMTLPAGALSTGRDGVLLVGLPRAWREGWGDDLHAPSRLRVFADGTPLPFFRREPAGLDEVAFFRRPRAAMLSVRAASGPAELVVVRESPLISANVQLTRLLSLPHEAAAVAALFAAVLVLGTIALGGRLLSPRVMVAAALGALVLWRALELYDRPWGPVLLAAECAAVMIVAIRAASSRRFAQPPAPRWLALRVQADGPSPSQK